MPPTEDGALDEAIGPVAEEVDGADEPPPILGSWRRLYAVVLLNLVVLIAAFTAFTRYFR